MLQILVWGMVASWSLLVFAWLTLHWGILAHIEQWKPQIEQRLGDALGAVVRIGRIEVRSGSWVPAVELRDVVVIDGQQREALRLPYVAAALAPTSLLALEPRLQQLLVEGADVDARMDREGRLWIGGLRVGAGDGNGDDEAADWFFRQHEFVVRRGRLRWIDERRSAPVLALTDVTLVVRNGLRQHDLRIDATPPDEWGARWSLQGRFTQPLLARASHWRRWSGEVQADLPRADIRRLRRHADLPFDLDQGEGALRAWLDVRDGEARRLTLDVALRTVAWRLGRDVEPLAFAEVEGRVVAGRESDGVSLSVEHLGFVTHEGTRWPRSDARLVLRGASDALAGPFTGGEFSAERLDLGVMSHIAAGLPLGDDARRLLAELAPEGIARSIAASWNGSREGVDAYRVKASVSGVSVAARPAGDPQALGRPGVRNVDVEIDATQDGGSASVSMNRGELDVPGVFEDPKVVFDHLSAQVAWSVLRPRDGESPQVEVQVREARFANADAQGDLTATWRTGAGTPGQRRFPGWLELDGRLVQGKATSVARYLPLELPASVRRYVGAAVEAGVLGPSSFHVKGDLKDFPFHRNRPGEFRIAALVQDARFNYGMRPGDAGATPASEWPALADVNVELGVDRGSMELRNGRARIDGIHLAGIQGAIRTLARDPLLSIAGTARGPASDALRFVGRTPIAQWTDHALSKTSATGQAELNLALELPLDDLDRSQVKGTVRLAGGDVRVSPDVPLLAGARGAVEFTRNGFSIVGASARVWGGDARFEGGTSAEGGLRFTAEGVATADGLRRAQELGPVARVADSLQGQAAYRLALGIVGDRTEIDLGSDLIGMASTLPAPLGKAADAALPLRYRTRLEPGQPSRDALMLDIGDVLQARYARELASAGTPERIVRGGIGVRAPAPKPASGVQANVVLESLDLDAWRTTLERWSAPVATPGAATPPTAATVASAASDSDTAADESAEGMLPQTIALQVHDLTVSSRHLTRVVAGVSQDGATWRANVDADQLNGYIEFRPSRRAQGAGRVYARLARLVLPRSDAEGVESILDEQPASVPALDIAVDDFHLNGLRLGRLEVEAVNRGREGAREWRLTRFNVFNGDATMTAIGNWVSPTQPAVDGRPARKRAGMTFQLDIADSGALLERLGKGRALKGGKGKLSGEVSWLGSPLSPDFATMSGRVNVAVDEGQFLKAEPGAARLLGVLSLQALPRRLMLDFRDVFEEGFRFDRVTGDIDIRDGVASTGNLRMQGVQAIVLIEGEADLRRETQDLRAIVVPQISAGTASLAVAAINPAVGVGTFLAQLFLRRPLMQAGTREFQVDGSWADPKVERVARKPTDPIPDVDPSNAGVAPAQPAPPVN